MNNIQNDDNLTYVSDEILSTSDIDEDSSILSVDENENLSQDSNSEVLEDSMDTIYISPDGTQDGSSETAPSNWAAALQNVNEGGSIIFLSGNYTNIISQTINKQITIKGIGEGVILDAQTNGNFFTISSDNVVVEGITFKNGFSYQTGGAISSTKATKIINCTFINNNARDGGGAVYFNGQYSLIANCSFYRNYVSLNQEKDGGAVRVGAKTNITNCIFDSNYGYSATGNGVDGGALSIRGENVIVDNCLFNNNSAYGCDGNNGGAINVQASNCIINNSNFTNNRATWDGAVSLRSSSNSVINCNFINNTANEGNKGTYGGGAILVYSTYNSVINCTFINNTAKRNSGGAIYTYNDAKNLKIFNCSFINNNATGSGGAIYFSTLDGVTYNNFTLINNYAGAEGGAIYFPSNLLDYTFTNDETKAYVPYHFYFKAVNNTAKTNGGTFCIKGSLFGMTFKDCNFDNSHSTNGNGGAIYILGELTDFKYENISFINVYAANGGAIYVGGAVKNLELNDKIIFGNNSATTDGGTFYVGGAVNNLKIHDVSFDTHAGGSGGAIYVGGAVENLDISNVAFTNIAAGSNGGVLYFGSSLTKFTYENLSFINTSAANGGAIFIGGAVTNVELNDEIIFRNNTATANGGTLYIGGAVNNLKIHDVSFDTHAGGSGGAIYMDKNVDTLDISNIAFTNITAGSNGGVLYFGGSLTKFTYENLSFINTSAAKGGAIYFKSVNDVNITGIKFINNTATADGGTLYFETTVTNVNIYDINFDTHAGSNGGAIYIGTTVTNMKLYNINVKDTYAKTGSGGVLYIGKKVNGINISNIDFTNIFAGSHGGAIFFGDVITGLTYNNLSFINTSSGGSGGAIYFTGAVSDLTLEDIEFYNNSATINGGTLYFASSVTDLTIRNIDFNSHAGESGGAIMIAGTVTRLNLDNVNITNTYAKNGRGGAIYITVSPLYGMNLSNVIFENISAGSFGGVIYFHCNDHSWTKTINDLVLTNVTVRNVSSGQSGGFIFVNGDLIDPIFDNVNVVNSSTIYDGGALYVADSCKNPVFNNVSFINISANRHAGAIRFNTLTNFTYNNLSFINTSAKGGSGGAIYIAGAVSDLTLEDIEFYNSSATGNGGTLYFASSVTDLTIRNIDFNSHAGENGGAILIADTVTRLNLDNVNITNTYAKTGRGGAIYITVSPLYGMNLSNVIFENISAGSFGGVIYFHCNDHSWTKTINDLILTNVTVRNVSSGQSGGFIFVNGDLIDPIFENVNVVNSSTKLDGGALYVVDICRNPVFKNVSFINTSANQHAGAIRFNTLTNFTYNNLSFINTSAKGGSGGAIYIAGAVSDLTLDDVIFYNNSATSNGGALFFEKSVTDFIVNNINFNKINANSGGVIYIAGATTRMNITNTNFSDTKANYGGALYFANNINKFNLINVSILNSTASSGGFMYLTSPASSSSSHHDDILLCNMSVDNVSAKNGFGGFVYSDRSINRLVIENVNFTNINATSGGGVFYLKDYYYSYSVNGFNLTNVNFNRTSSKGNGGVIYMTSASTGLLLKDSTFIDVNASTNGGIIYIGGASSNFNAENVNVTNVHAISGKGGAIYIESSVTNFKMNNSNLININALSDGGVIYTKGTVNNMNLTNIDFTPAHSGGNGGTIYLGGATDKLLFKNLNFTGSYATGNGGAVFFGNSLKNFEYSNLTFIHAYANGSGGAVYFTGGVSDFDCSDIIFIDNHAGEDGGSIYFASTVNGLFVHDIEFINTTAKNGGSIYINGEATRFNLTNVNFTNVNASGNGGVIYAKSIKDSNYYNLNLTDHFAGSSGGVIYILNTMTNFNMTDIYLANNKAIAGSGGVLYVGGKVTNLLMSNLNITNVSSGISGGFIYVNNALEKVTFDDIVIVNSSAESSAGAIYATAVTDVNLFNVSVINSSAKNGIGGAVYFNGAATRLKVIDVNFTNINATDNGGVIYVASMDACELANINFNNTRSTLSSGGAIFVNGIAKNSYMDNINFTEIHAKGSGGAIYISNQVDKVNFTNINVNTCSADSNNGGVFFFNCNGNRNSINDILMTNLTFNNTFAGDSGGIMYVNGQINRLTAKNMEILNTVATNNGGVLHTPNSVTDVTFDTVVINNTVAKTGDSGAFHLGNYVTRLTINNVNVTNSNSSTTGGLIYVYNGVTDMNLINCNIINSTSKSSSGGLIYFRCYNTGVTNLLMANLTINNSLANKGTGGLVHVNGALTNFEFINNTVTNSVANSGNGGTIYVGGAVNSFDFINNTVINSTSTSNGGTIYFGGAVTNFDFINNTVTNSEAKNTQGGTIYVYGALTTANFINTNITDSSSKTQGGVLFVRGKTTSIVMDNCYFTNTSASGAGGVISLNGETDNVIIYNTQFENYKQYASSKITNGGVIYLTASKDIDIQNVSFKNNIDLQTDGHGGILYIPSANNVNLNNVNFTHTYINSGSKYGGAMYLGSAARDVRLTNVIFANNTLGGTNSLGAALYIGEVKNYNVYLTNVSFDNTKITGNSGYGGAAYIGQTNDIYMTNVNFTNSHSTYYGGALYLTGTSNSMNLDNVKFINVSASNYGGAIYNSYTGVVNINDSLFENVKSGTSAVYFTKAINGIVFNNTDFINNTNSIPNTNGASINFAANSQNVQILNCNFNDTSVVGNGGAVYFNTVSNSKIVNSTFADSKAKLGGAIYISGGQLVSVTDSKFISNTAENGGGAIYWTGTRGSVSNSEFINNTATGDFNGGAIYITATATNMNILKSNFTGNNASNGGAIYVLASDTIINYSNFTKNNARYNGGAIYIADTTQRVNVLNSLFKNNTAAADGGAIYISGQSNKIVNSTFIANTANNGGGVYDYITNDRFNAINTIWNSTFTSNIAIANGGGTLVKKSESFIDGDDFSNKAIRDQDTSRLTWAFSGYSDVYYIFESLYDERNIDYQLMVKAIVDSTSTVNIVITLPPHVTKEDENDKKTSLMVYVTGDEIEPREYDVYPIDSNPVVIRDSFPVGNYSVKVVFSDDTYLEKENYTNFTIQQSKGDFDYLQGLINNYTSKGIQELVLNRSFIFTVVDGVDIDFSQINITADYPFTIRGEDLVTGGPITIDALGKCRIFLVNSSNITIKNINFVNGNVNGAYGDGNLNGGAIHWNANNGTLINCTFKDNTAEYGGGLYLNSTSSNCKIINCSFEFNNATYNGGAIDCNASYMSLTNTVFESNRGQYGAALCRENNAAGGFGYNNTFISNHAYKSGAALGWINATSIKIDTYYFYNNTADESGGAIYVGEGSGQCHILNSYFEGNNVTNKTSGTGGAIYWFAEEGLVFNTTFVNNNAFEGGAIYIGNSSNNINLTKSKFKANKAIGDGGAIYLGASTATLNYTEFYDNTAINGGAVYVGGNGTTNYIYNSVFKGNNATNGNGGAVDWVASAGHIIESNFTDNHANYGGAVYMGGDSKNSAISKVIFDGNTAKYNGGAIDWNSTGGNLTHTIFKNNVADYGAALCRESGATGGFGFNNTFRSNHARISGAALGWMGSVGININTYYFYDNTAGVSGAAIYVGPESHRCIINNSDFRGNHILDETTGIGGAIDCEAENATIINSNFTENRAANGGAIWVGSESGITNIAGSIFKSNTAYENGGAINLNSSSVNVYDSKFYTNRAINGAGMYVGGENLTNYIDSSLFDGNNASGGLGGAVDWVASSGQISDSTFKNNYADYGGGVYMGGDSKNSRISHVTFDGNIAKYNGGAIDWNSTGGNLTHTEFKNNVANYGAALCREAGATAGYGYNNTFRSNHARISGAALGWMGSVGININTYYFYDNTAAVSGAAIYVGSGSDNCVINNSLFKGNHILNETGGYGGAIDIVADNATIVSSNFTENNAYDGGAIYVGSQSGYTDISNTIFTKNTAVNNGGAINLEASGVTLNKTKFTSNSALNGGAIYVAGSGVTNHIYSSTFDENRANGGRGGAIDWVASTGNIYNSNFTENSADYGGGVYIGGNSSGSRITNVLFKSNTAKYNGGAIDWNATGGNLTNTKFVSNYAEYGAALCREANSTGGFGYNNTFISNHAYKSGAALGWLGAKGITINNYTFINNTADESGGSIYVGPGSENCKVYNSKFENSGSSKGRGGDIDWVASNGTVINSTFKNSNALYGGSIYVGENSNSTEIINSNFTQTRSLGSGGALDWHGDDGRVINCNFTSSFAFEKGGVISGSNVNNMVIDYSTFGYNMASGYPDGQGNAQGDGAAIFWENGNNLNLTNSRFNNNEGHSRGGTLAIVNTNNSNVNNISIRSSRSVKDGGAISWIDSNNITLQKVSIDDSSANYNGGSIFLENVDDFEIKDSKINNTSTPWGNGGALYVDGNVTINNVSFTDYRASADNAAAIFFKNGNSTLSNSTFVSPNSIWVYHNATVYLTKNNITGSNPNKHIEYLTQDYDSKYNPVDYSVWNDGTIYLEGNSFDYVIFNNGTIKTHVDIYILDNTTWNATLNENFTFFASIKDDKNNSIISVKSLDSYNNHVEVDKTFFMPYNRIVLPVTYQGVFVIFGTDEGLENFTLHTGIVQVKTKSKLVVNHTHVNDEIVLVTAKVTPEGNYSFIGTVTFKMGENEHVADISPEGIATWTLNNLSRGTYTVTATYSGDNTHTSAENFTLVDVELRKTWIKLVVENIVYGQYALVNLTTNANGTVLFSIHGKTQTLTIKKGKIIEYIDLLIEPGNHTMGVVYLGNEYYEYQLNSTKFIVFKQNTTIDVAPTNITYGENELINVTLNENATGYVKITIGNQVYLEPISQGVAKFNISGIAAGNYTNVLAEFNGSDFVNGNSTNFSFVVKPTKNYNITVQADDIKYHENATIIVYLPSDATGNVTIYIDDLPAFTNVNVTNGIATLYNVSGLDAGNHTVNVTYNGDKTYAAKDKNMTIFHVNPTKEWEINIDIEEHKYGENTIINITVPENVKNKNITVNIDGNNYTVNLTEGKGSLVLNNLSAGMHKLTANYTGDDRYSQKTASTKFFIEQSTPTIIISVDPIKVGENATITVNIPENVTGNVTIYVGNLSFNRSALNHIIELNVSGLAYGKHNIVVNYNGDVNYTKSTNKTILTVEKWNSEVKVNSTFNIYNVGETFIITVSNNTVVDNVTINGKMYSINSDKTVNVTTHDLEVGHYIVVASIYENSVYYANSSTFEFDIIKITPTIKANETVLIKVGENEVINVTVVKDSVLNKNATGIVKLNIKGKDYIVKLSNGNAQFNISGLASGNYTNVTVHYEGDANYNEAFVNVTFEVIPTDDYNISVKVDNIKYGENATIIVTLPGDATGNVTIYIDDLPAFTNVNVTNGIATLYNVSGLDAGNHTVNVTYNGDKTYAAKDKNATIFNVVPTNDWELNLTVEAHKFGDYTIFNVTLPSNVVKNVTLTIEKVNYTVVLTNGTGSYKLNNLSAGMHEVTAIYSGDDRYVAKSASKTFLIEQITPTIIISVDPIKVGENATITVNIPENVTGNVTIYVGNLSFNRSALNHIIELNVSGLAYGKHNIVVNYNGDVNYTKSTNKTILTVNKWNSEVKVIIINQTYMVGDPFIIKIENNTAANVTINGKTYNILENGNVNITTSDLSAGEYRVIATTPENAKYFANSSYAVFNIIKYNSTVSVKLIPTNSSYYVGSEFVINVTNNTAAKVTINGIEYTINSNGNVNVTTSELPAGKYIVVVTTPENNKYNSNSTNTSFTINKYPSSVKIIVNETHMFGDDFDIIIKNSTIVNVTINGKKYSVVDGKVNITTSKLPTGHYVVIATIYENGKFLSNTTTEEFDIIKLNSTVNVTIEPNETHYVGDTFVINVTNNTVAKVTINGKEYSINTNGNVNVTTSELAAGDYTVIATTPENDRYYSNSYTILFTIKKRTSSVNVTVGKEFVYGSEFNITVENNTLVNVTINGVAVGVNADKTLNIDSTTMAAGHYVVIATIYENGKYLGSVDTKEFDIIKLNSSVSIIIDPDGTHIVGDSFTIKIVNDTVAKVTINGDDYDVLDGGIVNVDTSLLPAGDYTVIATIPENDKYFADSATAKFTISKLASSVNITVGKEFVYGSEFNITVENNTLVNVTINGVAVGVNADKTLNIDSTTMAAGHYVVIATIYENGKYLGSVDTKEFDIIKLNSSVSIIIDPDGTHIVGDSFTIKIVNDTVAKVTINGKDYAIIDGIVNVTTSELAAGNYTVTATIPENDKYYGDSTTLVVVIEKLPSKVSVSCNDTVYGNDAEIIVSVPNDETGYVTIFINNKNYTSMIKNGQAIFNIAKLNVDSYNIDVKYLGDDKYLENTNKTSFNVIKSDLIANVVAQNVTTKENSSFIVTVPEDFSGNVNITVDGITYSGKANSIIKMPALSSGNKIANVVFFNDSNYNNLELNASFKVSNVTEAFNITTIKSDNMTRGWNSLYDFQATFLNEEGKALANTDVKFSVNGKIYTVKTNEAGIAQLSTSKLAVGEYNVTSINPVTGESTTNALKIVKRIILNKDLTMDFASGKSYVVRVIDDDGNYVGSGEIIDIYINTVHYVAKTNKDGYAKLKINLNPGKYTIECEYKSFKTTNKLVVKQTLKLVKKTVKVKKGKKLVLKAKLKWSNGKAIKGKKIVFKFKGKKYKAKTNSKGIAKVTIKSKVTKKLKKGKKYTYIASYKYNNVKGKVKVKK